MKMLVLFTAVILTSLFSGCTTEDIPTDWLPYRSAELGISFMHPPEYQNAEAEPGALFLQTGSIIVQQVFLRQERPISPFIIITRSSDPKILAEAARYHPLEKRSVNGQSAWFYRVDGMANPEGYIFNDGTAWISMEFIGTPEQPAFDQIIQTVRIGPAIWEK